MLETLWLLLLTVLHCLIYLTPTRYDFPMRSHWQLEECGGYTQACGQRFLSSQILHLSQLQSAQVTLPQLVITVFGFPGSCQVFYPLFYGF